jgi:hypothetical protein
MTNRELAGQLLKLAKQIEGSSYHTDQIQDIIDAQEAAGDEWKSKIKITGAGEQTKWMSIDLDILKQIQKVMKKAS